MDTPPPVTDWRRAEGYIALHHAGRPGFAWEWLRRMPAYRQACQSPSDDKEENAAARFGLHRLEPCERATPLARPVWRAEADPQVLKAIAYPSAADRAEPFDIRRLEGIATCHCSQDEQEHWLFSDGLRSIRLDLIAGTLAAGPVELEYRIAGLASALPPLTTLGRFIAVARTARLPPAMFARERRAQRWVLILRTADALAAGASQREIAEHLLGLEPARRWRIVNPSFRRRAQRLVEAARAAAKADPRLWLSGDFP